MQDMFSMIRCNKHQLAPSVFGAVNGLLIMILTDESAYGDVGREFFQFPHQ